MLFCFLANENWLSGIGPPLPTIYLKLCFARLLGDSPHRFCRSAQFFRRAVNNRYDLDFSLICERIATNSADADNAKI